MGKASRKKRDSERLVAPPPKMPTEANAPQPKMEVPLHRRTGTRVAALAVVVAAAAIAVLASRGSDSPPHNPVSVPSSASPIPEQSHAKINRSLDGRKPFTAEVQAEIKHALGDIVSQLLVTSEPGSTESGKWLMIFPEAHLFETEVLNPGLINADLKRLQSQLFEAMAHLLQTYDIRHVVYESGPQRNWVASLLDEYEKWSPDHSKSFQDFQNAKHIKRTGQASANIILETALDRSLTFGERYDLIAPYREEYPSFILLQAIYWDCPDINFVSPDIISERQQGADQRWSDLQDESRALLNNEKPVVRKQGGGFVMAHEVHAKLESGDFEFAEPYCSYRESYLRSLGDIVTILGTEREERWIKTIDEFHGESESSLLSVGAAHSFGVRDGSKDDHTVFIFEMTSLRDAMRSTMPGTSIPSDQDNHDIFTHRFLFGDELDATPKDFSFRDSTGVMHNCGTVLAGISANPQIK